MASLVWNEHLISTPVNICNGEGVTLDQIVEKLKEHYDVECYVNAWTSQGHVIVVRQRGK